MLAEFKDFVAKFNVLPIAIGLILALAFAPFVDAVATAVLSFIGALLGSEQPNFNNVGFDLRDGRVPIGPIITTAVSFLMIAFVVFQLVKGAQKAGMDTGLAETPDQRLLTEIRDLLAK